MFVDAKVAAGTWSYIVASKLKLAKGSYRVSAYGTDNGGAFGNSASAKRRIVRFTLK